MRKIERHLIYSSGALKSKSYSDKKIGDDFRITLKEGTTIRETLEIIGSREIWRDDARRGHFGILRQFVENCNEGFSIAGDTKDAKVSALHYTMKAQYCIIHPDALVVNIDAISGERKSDVFSVSREYCTLEDDTLEDFYTWTKFFINEVHFERFGYRIEWRGED
jgi:hypothetical protein